MLVKEILSQAAFLLGENALSEYIRRGADASASEEEKKELAKKTDFLLRCYNIVENEIALDYLPLTAEEYVVGGTDRIQYTSFSRTPVSVISVTDERGNKLPYTVFPEYLSVPDAGTAVVTYSYAPEQKALSGQTDYGAGLPERLFAYGVACEACVIGGAYDEATAWDKKYKDALMSAHSRNRPKVIRSRRWA